MSVNTTDISQEFTGDGSQTNFPFSNISFLENTAEDVFDVYIDDVLESTANWSITENAASDGVATGGTLIFTTAPANGETIKILRNHDKTQPTVFGASYTKASVRNAADRLLMQLQENLAKITTLEGAGGGGGGAVSSSVKISDWATATAYEQDEVVLYDDGVSKRFYRCLSDHTSGTFATDLLANNWEEIVIIGRKGDQGEKGLKGDKGDTGATGATGATGPAGADGIFSAIASLAETLAGTDNTKGITPLRLQSKITDALSAYTTTTNIDSKNTSQDAEISNAKQRITTLENVNGINQFSGKQRLQNNVATVDKVALQGKDADTAELGYGLPMQRDKDGTEFARITCLVKRRDDTETRFVQVTLVMHYISGTWYIGRENTVVLNGGNPDGVTFSIDTDGDGVGLVSYETDNMAGGNYSGEIFWLGTEIPITIDGDVS